VWAECAGSSRSSIKGCDFVAGGLMIYGERRRLPVDLFLFLMAKTGNRGGVRASKM